MCYFYVIAVMDVAQMIVLSPKKTLAVALQIQRWMAWAGIPRARGDKLSTIDSMPSVCLTRFRCLSPFSSSALLTLPPAARFRLMKPCKVVGLLAGGGVIYWPSSTCDGAF